YGRRSVRPGSGRRGRPPAPAGRRSCPSPRLPTARPRSRLQAPGRSLPERADPAGAALRCRIVSPAAAAALFLGSLALSVASSVVLARHLDRIAVRLGLTEALVGIVTALGADAPEISSAITAVARGHEDTGVGVVLGSNV